MSYPLAMGMPLLFILTMVETMLIDGGGQFHQGEMQPPRVLIEYVRRKKIKSIDVMVVSHPDPDHIIGLIEILKHIEVKTIGTVVSLSGTHSMRRLLEEAKRKHTRVYAGADLSPNHYFGNTLVSVLAPKPAKQQSFDAL